MGLAIGAVKWDGGKMPVLVLCVINGEELTVKGEELTVAYEVVFLRFDETVLKPVRLFLVVDWIELVLVKDCGSGTKVVC